MDATSRFVDLGKFVEISLNFGWKFWRQRLDCVQIGVYAGPYEYEAREDCGVE